MDNSFLADQRNNVDHFNYYYFNNVFSKEELEQIHKFGKASDIQPASILADTDASNPSTDFRKSKVGWIFGTSENNWLYDKISGLVKTANKNTNWNFDIWGYADALQYTIYHGDGGHYNWHVDMGAGASNRKMSVVLQLSDPSEYEGGELQIDKGGNIVSIPRELGLICMFPSFLLHRVTPVTSGKRVSLVTWMSGANFR